VRRFDAPEQQRGAVGREETRLNHDDLAGPRRSVEGRSAECTEQKIENDGEGARNRRPQPKPYRPSQRQNNDEASDGGDRRAGRHRALAQTRQTMSHPISAVVQGMMKRCETS